MTRGYGCSGLLIARIFMTALLACGFEIAAAGQQTPRNEMVAQGLQESAAKNVALPTFAVATVKPAKNEVMSWGWRYTPDGVSLTGVPMLSIACFAFDREADRIIGLPNWIKDQRFDIEAKVDPADAPKLKDLNYHQRYAMLVQVLVERFNLKFHHETRVLPVFDLVVAKGGSKLTESKPDSDGKTKDGGWSMGNGRMDATATTIDALTAALTQQVEHPVLDKTALTGHYDFKLRWTPDNTPSTAGADGTSAASDNSAPDLFTAVQEQLGLKLESRKEPLDVVVIDRIEKPSEN
ncbi:MAG TPA: TIGR03435 family protein [Terracidiphilus sp.]|nr:TIGR03435 family protein [Terracidiphilus sp.]